MNKQSLFPKESKKIYGSDVMVNILKQHGIKYVACNPGATIRGLHDSVVNDAGDNPLTLVLCCHEEISVAIAHGYAKATGQCMAVFIHTNVGLQHASMAVFNAWCDRVPILLIGGVGPLDITKRRPWIDWIHTSNDQASVLRGYIKWEDQPVGLYGTRDALYRAFRIANTEPKAPVYVGIDASIQEEITEEFIQLEDIKWLVPIVQPQADNEALNQLAELLVSAESPVVLVDYMGKNPDSVAHLVALAELLALPVIDKGGRYNFPNTHQLYMGSEGKEFLSTTDCILTLDVQDLYGAFGYFDKEKNIYVNCLNDKAMIAHISLSDYLISSSVADYQKLAPIDLPIAANTLKAIPELVKLCKSKINSTISAKIEKRLGLLQAKHLELRKNWLLKANNELSKNPISIPAMVLTIWESIENEKWILANGGNTLILDWIRKLWKLDKPGCYLGFSGGAGLGYGLGASIGAALAYKNTDTICINLQCDGDFLFTPSALWTAAHYEVPLLIIMMNNRSYNNTKEHAEHIAEYRNRPRNNATVGSDLTQPNVDYPKLAESFGIKSYETIQSIEKIKVTIKLALAYIKKYKKPALIDLIIE